MLDLRASYFHSYRLPELYWGMPRQLGAFPVQYPGDNIPPACWGVREMPLWADST